MEVEEQEMFFSFCIHVWMTVGPRQEFYSLGMDKEIKFSLLNFFNNFIK